MFDIGQRVNKFFPQYQRHYTGYVVAQPEPEDAEELYVVFYPEDNDEETMTRADVQKWDDGMLGDGGDDNLGDGCVVDEQDLLGTLLRAYYARQDVEVGVPQHGGGGGGGGDAGGSAKAHAQQQGGDDTRSSNNTEKPPAKEKQRKLKQKAQKSKGPNVASGRNNTKRPPARPATVQVGLHQYRPGQRISKYFPIEGCYFDGTIDTLVQASDLERSEPGVNNYYHVKYDDGDEEHMTEDKVSNSVLPGVFAPGYAVDGETNDNETPPDAEDTSSEDDAKPPARKRNRMSDGDTSSTDENSSSAAAAAAADDNDTSNDAKCAAALAAAYAVENYEYVEGGKTFEARVVDHRVVQCGGEQSKSVLKFLVEWRRKSDVAAAVATAAAAAASNDDDSDSTSSSSAVAAMEIEVPVVAPNIPPLSSSWIRLDEFIAPSAALAYLNNITHLPDWDKEDLVKEVIAFRDVLARDNTFGVSKLDDEPPSCGEIDFCCYLCRCGRHTDNRLVKCNSVSKYHRGCCHGLDTEEKLQKFRSSLGRTQEMFLNQTTGGGGASSDNGGMSDAVSDGFLPGSKSAPSELATEEHEKDKKLERHMNNFLDSRKRSAISRESRTDNDLALAAPHSQRWTDERAVAVHKGFQQLLKERTENPDLKREAVVLEVFAGIGGATVALKKLGIAVKRNIYVEHDRAALDVHRYNHDPSYGSGVVEDDGVEYIYSLYETYEELEANIKRIVQEQGPIDIVVGGPPCQDHSKVNARRKGVEGEHGRYMRDFPKLISEVQRYNKELHNGFDDLLFLVENVPGSQDATANYKVSEYRCDAAYFGPCHRDRIFYFNWQPDPYPEDEHPAGGTICLAEGWMMPTMFQKGIDAKVMTLLASKGRIKDETLFKFRSKESASAINPCEDRPATQVGDKQYFDTNDRERLMGLPVGYVERPIEDLFANLRRATTVGLETEVREWRDVVPPMYWSFLGLGPDGYTYTLDNSFDDNDPRRIALGLKEKNQKSKVCMKDFEYGWHLIGNGFSIPQVVYLLRPLQQLFCRRDYAGYTDKKFAWEDGNGEAGNGADNPLPADGIGGHANTDGVGDGTEDYEIGPSDTNVEESAENRDNTGVNAAMEKDRTEISEGKAHDTDFDSSDDDYSL